MRVFKDLREVTIASQLIINKEGLLKVPPPPDREKKQTCDPDPLGENSTTVALDKRRYYRITCFLSV